ncbi:ParA family protein [Methylobacterium sp. ID0610]|uniref:ParA family protein n=1 Tax=Methylobacterium carpenticola TaxID=3344827 RepID=UPI0036764A34
MTAAVIAVSNRKGGTAKTTTAVNLAAELGARGRRVLVLDLDTQGHAGLGFGLRPGPGEPTVHDTFRGGAPALARAVRATPYPNIDLAPADRGFEVGPEPIAPASLARALDPLRAHYDAVLIDTSPSADALLVAALAAADHVLVPTLLHHLAVDGVGQFARSYVRVAATLNPRLTGISLLPVQVDMRVTMQRETRARLAERFGETRLLAGIRPDIALAEAFGSHRPVKYHKPRTRSVVDFEALCDHVCFRVMQH